MFVHDVIAAITTEPWVSLYYYPPYSTTASEGLTLNPLNETGACNPYLNSSLNLSTVTLSCGLFGPETHGLTSSKLSSITSEYSETFWGL